MSSILLGNQDYKIAYLKAHLLRATLSTNDLVWAWAARLGLATILRHLAEAAMKDILSVCCEQNSLEGKGYIEAAVMYIIKLLRSKLLQLLFYKISSIFQLSDRRGRNVFCEIIVFYYKITFITTLHYYVSFHFSSHHHSTNMLVGHCFEFYQT